MFRFDVLADNVVAIEEPAQEQTVSGIYIPESARESTRMARVIAVGPGRVSPKGILIPMDMKPGDIVVYGRYAGMDFKKEDVDYIFLKQGDVVTRVEG